MNDRDVIAWLLVVLAAVDVSVTVVLVRAARRLNEPALAERATISILLTIGGVALAILGAARLVELRLPPTLAFWLLIGVFVIVSLPQLVWFALYRLGRFR